MLGQRREGLLGPPSLQVSPRGPSLLLLVALHIPTPLPTNLHPKREAPHSSRLHFTMDNPPLLCVCCRLLQCPEPGPSFRASHQSKTMCCLRGARGGIACEEGGTPNYLGELIYSVSSLSCIVDWNIDITFWTLGK